MHAVTMELLMVKSSAYVERTQTFMYFVRYFKTRVYDRSAIKGTVEGYEPARTDNVYEPVGEENS